MRKCEERFFVSTYNMRKQEKGETLEVSPEQFLVLMDQPEVFIFYGKEKMKKFTTSTEIKGAYIRNTGQIIID